MHNMPLLLLFNLYRSVISMCWVWLHLLRPQWWPFSRKFWIGIAEKPAKIHLGPAILLPLVWTPMESNFGRVRCGFGRIETHPHQKPLRLWNLWRATRSTRDHVGPFETIAGRCVCGYCCWVLLLGGVGWCWVMLGNVGWCWLLLAVVLSGVGWCWVVLGGVGWCWLVLAVVGCCWLLLAVVGFCWLLLAVVGDTTCVTLNIPSPCQKRQWSNSDYLWSSF